MGKWEIARLAKVCRFINGDRGKNYPSRDDFCDNGVPFINAGHLTNGLIDFKDMNYISENKCNLLGSGKVQSGDILYCLRGSLGKHAVVKNLDKGAIASSLVILRPIGINVNYLLHLLKSPLIIKQQKAANNGSSQPNLSADSVKKYEIPLPPLTIQQKIADVLDKASTLIEKRKAQIDKLDLLIKSQFIEMFGDPVVNPKGWAVRTLKEVTTTIQSGNTPKGGKQVYIDSGIMFFRSQNVWKNRIVLADIAYIDEKTHQKMNQTKLKNKDILMTKTGRFNTENSSLGRAALFLGEDDSANINGHVYLVRLKESAVHEFILYILITDEYRDYIRNVCVGGIDKRQINKEHLEKFPIIMPAVELQNQFADFFLQVEAQKSLLQQSLKKMEINYKSLMQKCFRGEMF